jgi:hypothetical protein
LYTFVVLLEKLEENCIICIDTGFLGGLAVVCARWDKEVREARHQIMVKHNY